jgi:hypothetical protein
MEVNHAEPFPSVRVPWFNPCQHSSLLYITDIYIVVPGIAIFFFSKNEIIPRKVNFQVQPLIFTKLITIILRQILLYLYLM